MASTPVTPSPSMGVPFSGSRTTGSMPKKGKVADPGLRAVAPGSGVIRMPPVSVCHQVSTMGQRSLPALRWYQRQASGLIGSPTVPSRRREGISYLAGHSSPAAAMARMAVGAV